MYKEVLRSIQDISLFPVIAIVIFIAFFTVLMVYVIRMDRRSVKQMASLPLDTQEPELTPISPNGQMH
ncbi:MAG: hypothetical protein NW241_03185 [Bacteroidia bacterium]|nr:hypothetical protein [Bacteroidia bacterium]